jgi:L-lysine exporter family protein LysE/ArgO
MVLAAMWRGGLLGLGAAAPIGPINVEIARRTLHRGFRAGFAMGCGACSVDVVYAALSSLALHPANNHPLALRFLGLGGGLFLGWLGFLSLRSAWRNAEQGPVEAAAPGASTWMQHAGNYLTGMAMTSLNPMTLVFWFSAVGTITQPLHHEAFQLCAGVGAGTVLWVCVFAGAMSRVGKRGRRRWLRAADLAGGATLLSFAGAAIWQAVRQFIR